MILTGCVDNTATFWCSRDGEGYHLIIDEKAAPGVSGTQISYLAFCGGDCSPEPYNKIGDLFFFNDDVNIRWVFDEYKMTLKRKNQGKIYRCRAVEER